MLWKKNVDQEFIAQVNYWSIKYFNMVLFLIN